MESPFEADEDWRLLKELYGSEAIYGFYVEPENTRKMFVSVLVRGLIFSAVLVSLGFFVGKVAGLIVLGSIFVAIFNNHEMGMKITAEGICVQNYRLKLYTGTRLIGAERVERVETFSVQQGWQIRIVLKEGEPIVVPAVFDLSTDADGHAELIRLKLRKRIVPFLND